MNNETIGWLGAACFAVCAFPQVWQCFKDGHARGMSLGTMILWTVGEILTIIYVLGAGIATWQLMTNYGLNLFGLLFIWYYKINPRKP